MRGVMTMRGLVLGTALAAGVALVPAQAQEAAQTGLGVVYGEIDTARSVCPGLAVEEAALAGHLAKAGIDPQQPSAAFKRGQAEADARSSEAIANERLRSFCLDVVKSYGPEGSSIQGLVRPR